MQLLGQLIDLPAIDQFNEGVQFDPSVLIHQEKVLLFRCAILYCSCCRDNATMFRSRDNVAIARQCQQCSRAIYCDRRATRQRLSMPFVKTRCRMAFSRNNLVQWLDDEQQVLEWLHYPGTATLLHPGRPTRDHIVDPMTSESRLCGPTETEYHPANDHSDGTPRI